MKFMIQTTDGKRVFAGTAKQDAVGMDEAQAKSSCNERNERAQAMGIAARYVVVPFVALVT